MPRIRRLINASFLVLVFVSFGVGCVRKEEPASIPIPEEKPIVFETPLAAALDQLMKLDTGSSIPFDGRTGEQVLFYVADDQRLVMKFPYTIPDDPVVFFKENAPMLSANTEIGDWVQGESLSVVFRPTDPNRIVEEAQKITDALYGKEFFGGAVVKSDAKKE